MAIPKITLSDLTSQPGSGSKEANEKASERAMQLAGNGHARRRLHRDFQIPFRCTAADRDLLRRLSDTLKCSFTDTLTQGLHALDEKLKGERKK